MQVQSMAFGMGTKDGAFNNMNDRNESRAGSSDRNRKQICLLICNVPCQDQMLS